MFQYPTVSCIFYMDGQLSFGYSIFLDQHNGANVAAMRILDSYFAANNIFLHLSLSRDGLKLTTPTDMQYDTHINMSRYSIPLVPLVLTTYCGLSSSPSIFSFWLAESKFATPTNTLLTAS
jgi:hypothetical protein